MMNMNPFKTMTYKRTLASILAASLIVGASPAAFGFPAMEKAAAATAVQTYRVVPQPFIIDDYKYSIPTININGSTYIGIRSLNEKLGLDITWNVNSRTITLDGRGRKLTANPEDGSYVINGQKTYGDPALIYKGSAYVPLRFLLERMGYGISYEKGSKTVVINTIEENELTVALGTIEENSDKQTLLVNYPVIEDLKDKTVEGKINTYLKQEAESYAAAGQKDLSIATVGNAAYIKKNPGTTLPKVTFEGAFNVTYNEQGRLSLYVDYYSYLGGAHGITIRVPYTFDLNNGELLTLKEAADYNSKYLSIINASINKQIKERKLPLIAPFNGIKSNRSFYLKHEGIAIAFEQYEYTSYAEGMPEFVTPFEAFE